MIHAAVIALLALGGVAQVRQNIGVAGRSEWVVVKVHTQGSPEKRAASCWRPWSATRAIPPRCETVVLALPPVVKA